MKKKDDFSKMGKISRLMLETAQEMGIGYEIVHPPYVYRLKKAKKEAFFYATYMPINQLSGSKVSDHKKITKKVWEKHNIPVAKDFIINKNNWQGKIKEKEINIKFPVVLKPLSGTIQGYGVVTDIKTKRQLNYTVKKMIKKGIKQFLVEEFYSGLNDYRVLVLNGKVIAGAKRVPAYVEGDGKKNIKELINEKNMKRTAEKKIKLGKIKIDLELKNSLKTEKLKLKSILTNGRKLQLKNVCNLATGGEVENVTDQICAYNKKLAIKAAESIDLNFAGLDFLCKDISKPLKEGKGILIEVNEQPDFALHHFPQKGKSVNVAKQLINASLK